MWLMKITCLLAVIQFCDAGKFKLPFQYPFKSNFFMVLRLEEIDANAGPINIEFSTESNTLNPTDGSLAFLIEDQKLHTKVFNEDGLHEGFTDIASYDPSVQTMILHVYDAGDKFTVWKDSNLVGNVNKSKTAPKEIKFLWIKGGIKFVSGDIINESPKRPIIEGNLNYRQPNYAWESGVGDESWLYITGYAVSSDKAFQIDLNDRADKTNTVLCIRFEMNNNGKMLINGMDNNKQWQREFVLKGEFKSNQIFEVAIHNTERAFKFYINPVPGYTDPYIILFKDLFRARPGSYKITLDVNIIKITQYKPSFDDNIVNNPEHFRIRKTRSGTVHKPDVWLRLQKAEQIA